MAQDDKKPKSETEIDLNTGKALNQQPVNVNRTEDTTEDVPVLPGHGKVSSKIAEIGKDMDDYSFIHALAEAADDSLITWEDCPLPSGGLYYPGWSNDIVMVRPMTQSVEKVFANKRLTSSGQALDIMFNKCCKFPGDFDAADLLVGDRTFLLYYIRGLTYGNLYKFAMTCPHCGAQSTHTYDMNELYNSVMKANPNLGPEPFKVVLPYLSELSNREVWVGLRFLRSRDINDILNRRKFNKRLEGNSVRAAMARKNRRPGGRPQQNQASDQSEAIMDGSLEKAIVSVNGITDPMVVNSIVSKLHSRDNAVIREFLLENTPGIDTTVTIECPECQNEVTMELPITDGFFRSVE